jgi:hypothetical protein
MDIKITKHNFNKILEIQYLKGRLDELQLKAYPNILNINKQRKIDARIEKYYNKLKNVDELSYYLYIIEHENRAIAKLKSKKKIAALLENILPLIDTDTQKETYEKIKSQLDSYML